MPFYGTAGRRPPIMPQNDVDHRQHRQRLKERFLQEGLDSFDPVNILELMLF